MRINISLEEITEKERIVKRCTLEQVIFKGPLQLPQMTPAAERIKEDLEKKGHYKP